LTIAAEGSAVAVGGSRVGGSVGSAAAVAVEAASVCSMISVAVVTAVAVNVVFAPHAIIEKQSPRRTRENVKYR